MDSSKKPGRSHSEQASPTDYDECRAIIPKSNWGQRRRAGLARLEKREGSRQGVSGAPAAKVCHKIMFHKRQTGSEGERRAHP